MKYLILEQKYFELIEDNQAMEALIVYEMKFEH